jgi:hypothetical protein
MMRRVRATAHTSNRPLTPSERGRLIAPCPIETPSPWQSGAAGPFLWIEDSPVEVWALGEDRFAVRAPDHEQFVVGFDAAQQAAHALAAQLDE